MTKIIAPLYQHDIISKLLLEDQDILLNTSLLPLNSFVDSCIDKIDSTYDFDLKETLNSLKPQLQILGSYLDQPSFIKDIKTFHIDMYLYNIKVDDLPQNKTKDLELHTIFSALKDFKPLEILKYESLSDIIKDLDLSDVLISRHSLKSNYERELVSLLKAHGVKEFKEKDYTISSAHVYYANNMRSEVEASAQLIIENNLKNPLVVLLDDSYKPVLKQVYDRYNILNSLNFINDNDTYNIKFLSVFKLLLRQDKESVRHFLSSNPFECKEIKSMSILNDFFNMDYEGLLNYSYRPLNDKVISQHDIKYYEYLSENSLDGFRQVQDILKTFENHSSLSLIENVYNYFLEHHYSDNLLSIQSTLLKNQDLLKETDSLYNTLESILRPTQSNLINSDHCVVVSLNQHHYFDKQDVILLGSTLKNYPSLETLSGVIDETYVKHLKYPSKTKRLQNQLSDLESLKDGHNIYVFYSLSGYDGKALEPSFSLLNFAKDNGAVVKRYPLIENDNYSKKEYKLNKDLAEKLFFKDGHLYGSISSFETYSNCPYAYYLRNGLKLYPKSLPSLSYAYLGSVTHAIIETLIDRVIKNSGDLNYDEVIEIIEEYFASLDLMNNPQVEIVKLTLIKHFKQVLDHMKSLDEDTLFKPILLEEAYRMDINKNITVEGRIDRVDQYSDMVRVVDYKSSRHTLSATSLKQGLQLQLVTYLIAISEKLNLKPSGAYYKSLKLENTSVSAAIIKKSSPYFIPVNDEDIERLYLDENKMQGWHFDDNEDFYKSPDYINGLYINKDDNLTTRRVYNFNTVSTVLEEVYTQIYNNLKDGNIDCVPIDNPCQFCEYQSICLSPNSTNNKDEVYPNQKLHEELDTDETNS